MIIMQSSSEVLKQLGELLDAGAIRTVVTKTYPLFKAPAAWTYLMSSHKRGKLVLEIPA
jgi:NADPH:quinone reductase-like Zn-dependent oxidoreductase